LGKTDLARNVAKRRGSETFRRLKAEAVEGAAEYYDRAPRGKSFPYRLEG